MTSEQRARAKKKIKDLIKEEIKDNTLEGVSPVTGKQFKRYSKDYALKKGVSRSDVDLRLSESMMNNLVVKEDGNGILVTVNGVKNQLKADNHNKFSAASETTPVPARKFIPNAKKDETFSRAIIEKIAQIIEEEKSGR